MQQIRTILELIKENRINVLEIERQSGISSGRIYKWLKGEGNPKAVDSEKLLKWAYEHLPKEVNQQLEEKEGLYDRMWLKQETVPDPKAKVLDSGTVNITLADYINKLEDQISFLRRMMEAQLTKIGSNSELQIQLLSGMQSDLLARSQVALESLARIENPKKPPKLNEDADRISAESQGMLPSKGNGRDGNDG